jgi:NitT/TauT family transport system substrate-binding protein
MKTLIAAAVALLAVTGAQAEPVKLRIQYANLSTHLTPIVPLVPDGVLRHYGKSYTIEPVNMLGSTPALTALAAKQLELAALGSQAFALAISEAKLDVRAIAQVVTVSAPGRPSSSYWVRKAEIARIEQLKGKVVATNARGGTVHAGSLIYLKRHGLVEDRDYQTVEIRFPAMLPALVTGKADLVFLVEPFDKEAERNPALAKLFSAGDAIGPFETGFWVGNTPWIAANRAALVDFCEDMIRFRRWVVDPKTAPEARALLSKLGKQPVEAYANVFTDRDTGYRDPNLILDVAHLRKNLRDLIDAGILTEANNIAANDFVDMSLAREAAARVAGR